MSYLYKRTLLPLLVTLLLSCPLRTKTEPFSLLIGLGGGFAARSFLNYASHNPSKSDLPPSPEVAAAQSENLCKKALRIHRNVIQANNCKTEASFCDALSNQFLGSDTVSKQASSLHLSLSNIDEKIDQIENICSTEKAETSEYNRLLQAKKQLQQTKEKLASALRRLNNNQEHLKLQARLYQLKEDQFSFKKVHQALEEEEYLENKLRAIKSIGEAARRLGIDAIEDQASHLHADVATAHSESLRKKALRIHRNVIEANNCKTEASFRSTLSNQFVGADTVSKQANSLHSSLNNINEKIDQIKNLRSTEKTTASVYNRLLQAEKQLQQTKEKLASALRRFNNNQEHLKLQARLYQLKEAQFSARRAHQALEEERYLENKLRAIKSIEKDAKRLGIDAIEDQASRFHADVRCSLNNLIASKTYMREYNASLRYFNDLDLRKMQGATIEEQNALDLNIRRHEVLAEKHKNALHQQEIDIAEGRVAQRIEAKFREKLAQKEDKLCQAQDSLGQTQKALDSSLTRERSLKDELTEKTRLIAVLQKELKKYQTR